MAVNRPVFSFITEIRRLSGMVKDYISARIPESKYIDAENIRLSDPAVNNLGGASLTTGNEYKFDLGNIFIQNSASDYTGLRIVFDTTATDIEHSVTIGGVTIHLLKSTAVTRLANGALPNTPNGYYDDLKIQLTHWAGISSITATPYIDDPTPSVGGIKYVGFKIFGVDAELGQNIVLVLTGAVYYKVEILKEFYGTTHNGSFEILNTFNSGEDLFILATNGSVLKIDVANKNEATGNWTNTTVFQTKKIIYGVNDVIDLDYQLAFGERCSLYYTGKPPRVTYFKHQSTWTTQSSFIWNEDPAFIVTGNTDGYYTFDGVAEETKLQVVKNFARVTNATVQTGGALKSGDKMYLVRQLMGTTAKSGFSIMSNPISIFSDNLADTKLKGNVGGVQTNKQVTLEITDLDPSIYDHFEIVCVENTDGVLTSNIIGKYPIPPKVYPYLPTTIIHTGYEAVIGITDAELITQQVVILDAKNNVIARNRLFLSNISIELDTNLAAWFKSFTVTTVRGTLPAIGKAHDTVNEYQIPTNVYNRSDYMLNETYRLGGIVFQTNGYISSAYFIKDHKITYGTDALTDIVGGGDNTPANIYTYYPHIAIPDPAGAPTINGVPFNQAVYGISIVRQPCIPEVLATGYVMPQTYQSPDDKKYTVGMDIACQDLSLGGMPNLKNGALLLPDNLFNITDINFVTGDYLNVYEEPTFYNSIDSKTFPLAGTLNQADLFEVNGAFTTPTVIHLEKSETVGFNSVGTSLMSGNVVYSTEVVTQLGTGCQQKSIAIKTTEDLPNTGLKFYYCQYVRPATGKYGLETNGNYISCGHFLKITGQAGYNFDLHGGDTFTQKNITKFNNRNGLEPQVTLKGLWGGAAANYTYIYKVIAYNGATPLVQGDVSIVINGTNDLLAHYLTWQPVKGADAYTLAVSYGLNWITIYAGNNLYFTVNSATTGIIAIPPTPLLYVSRTALSYYTQNRNNLQMRNFTLNNSNNYPYTTTDIDVWITKNELDEGELRYSQSYTPINPIQKFSSFDKDLPRNAKQPNVLYYSELEIIDSISDPYRIFKPLNNKAYSENYGGIENTFNKENALFILMDNAVLNQQLDQQQVISDPNNPALILGDGSVVGAREQVISYFGSPLKTAALEYLTKTGSWYIIWYNPYQKKVYRHGQDGIRVLSEENFNQVFFTNNNQFSLNERDIIFGWDAWSQEVLMRAKANLSETGYNIATLWDSGSTYTKNNLVYKDVFVGGGLQTVVKQYFKARINVPVNKDPKLISNQLNYWEIYRDSNYLIAFNEHSGINDYTSFYSYTCDGFVPYKNTFLTNLIAVEEVDAPTVSSMYEHNINTLHYYNMVEDIKGYVTIMFNRSPEIYKALRNSWIRCSDTILTDLHFRGSGNSKTFSVQSDIIEKRPNEGAWWSNVKNDAQVTNVNPNGLNDAFTMKVGGQTNSMTIFFTNDNNTKFANIDEVELNSEPKPRLYNT